MKFLGYETLAIRDLKLPGNWREIKTSDAVARMRKSIGRYGILQDPVVRKKDYLLVFGAHRIAAIAAEGMPMVHCKLVDCTDIEVEALRRIENGDRRHDVAWGKTNYVELLDMLTKQEAEKPPAEQAPTVSGKPHSPRRLARDKVAAELGIKSESVRQAERRNRARQEAAAKKPDPQGAPIRTIGIELAPAFIEQVAALQASFQESATLLARAQGVLTSIETRQLPVHDARFQRARDALAEVGAAVRGLLPTSLCPFCKGVDAIQKACAGCSTTGYVTKDQEKGIPSDLWHEENPTVLVDGRFRPRAEFVTAEEEPPASNAGPDIVDEDEGPVRETEEPLW